MRRGNGDGSIFKLSGKRRKPYAVRVTVGYTDEGKQQYRYIGYYPSKTEAKNALNDYLVNPHKIKLERKTLKSIFDNMIEKSKFSDGTKQQYRSGFNQLTSLHDRFINEIELDEIEDILEDHNQSAQLRIKKTLSNCYKFAMRYDYVSKNLADYLDVETSKAKERSIFTVEEIQNIWNELNTYRFSDVPLILLYTGMRISELLELETKNIDLENETLFIEKSKTLAGIRTIPIHNKIFNLIKARYNPNNSHLLMIKGEPFTYSKFASSYWKQTHTIHETRHTFVTHLEKATDDKIAMKKIIGHSLSDITDHYTHRSIDDLKDELNKLSYE